MCRSQSQRLLVDPQNDARVFLTNIEVSETGCSRYNCFVKGWGLSQLEIDAPQDTTKPRNWTSSLLTVRLTELKGASDCQRNKTAISKYDGLIRDCQKVAIESTVLECEEKHVMYRVNITWVNGSRSLAYDKSRIEPQPKRCQRVLLKADNTIVSCTDYAKNITTSDDPETLSGYDDFVATTTAKLPYWNSVAILEQLTRNLATQRSISCYANASGATHDWTASDGSSVSLTPIQCAGTNADPEQQQNRGCKYFM